MNFETKSVRGTPGATARVALPAAAAVALILASCGGGDSGLATQGIDDLSVVSAAATIEPTASSAAPVTVAAPATAAALPATVPPPTALPTTPFPSPADDGGQNPFGGNSPEDFLMPAVVCLNLQEAQDEIQDHGVFLSRSEDATGQGRMQINDSNWLVVGQSPEIGAPISEGDAVLFVVKYDDDYQAPC